MKLLKHPGKTAAAKVASIEKLGQLKKHTSTDQLEPFWNSDEVKTLNAIPFSFPWAPLQKKTAAPNHIRYDRVVVL